MNLRAVLTLFLLTLAGPTLLVAQDECASCSQCSSSARRQYQPNDPWTQGRIWQRYTGHFGLFYNCDGEENKRCSPYIQWGQESKWWTGETLRKSICEDLRSVRERIYHGAGICRRPPANANDCTCADCARIAKTAGKSTASTRR